MTQATKAGQSAETTAVKILESLPQLTVRLLVAMFGYQPRDLGRAGDFLGHQIQQIFSDYLEKKGLDSENFQQVKGRLQELECYGLVKLIKGNIDRDFLQSMFIIVVSIDTVLEANLGEGSVREELLRIIAQKEGAHVH